MVTRAVLFDLDGTLLPMDQDVFVKAYFGGIAAKLAPYGYEPKALIGAI
jgi:FMN phosphatase YigB (HAD superfamily)